MAGNADSGSHCPELSSIARATVLTLRCRCPVPGTALSTSCSQPARLRSCICMHSSHTGVQEPCAFPPRCCPWTTGLRTGAVLFLQFWSGWLSNSEVVRVRPISPMVPQGHYDFIVVTDSEKQWSSHITGTSQSFEVLVNIRNIQTCRKFCELI